MGEMIWEQKYPKWENIDGVPDQEKATSNDWQQNIPWLLRNAVGRQGLLTQIWEKVLALPQGNRETRTSTRYDQSRIIFFPLLQHALYPLNRLKQGKLLFKLIGKSAS